MVDAASSAIAEFVSHDESETSSFELRAFVKGSLVSITLRMTDLNYMSPYLYEEISRVVDCEGKYRSWLIRLALMIPKRVPRQEMRWSTKSYTSERTESQ